MDNKYNFMGIIIPVIVAVILLTVLPIINGINEECPPCEVCPSYNIGNIEVNPDFSSGNYIVDKGSYDYIDSVTIIKDDNLTPENIKKDVNIFGIVGTLEGASGGSYSVTLNRSGSGDLYYKKDNDATWTELTTSTVVNNVNSLISIGRGAMSMEASLEISDSVYIISSFYEDNTHIITLSNNVNLGYPYDIMLKTIVVNKNLVINISVTD